MSTLADLRARVARSVDRVAGQKIEIIPMLPGGGYVARQPDPSRRPYQVTATVSSTSRIKRREGTGSTDAENLDARLSSRRASLAPAEIGRNPAPEQGWRVRLLEFPGRPECEIANLERPEDAHGRFILHLA